jgi:DNA primase
MPDKSIIARIQQANDIVDVVSEHVGLVRKGKELVGLCPFHEDHRPSLYVSPVKQIFKCFACGAGGDVLKFVQMRENLTFPQTIERLAERAGIKIKPAARSKTKEQSTELNPNSLARVNEWAAKCFQANLADPEKGAEARKYLDDRQITSESIKKWRIGLAASNNDLLQRAKAQNIPVKLLIDAGLIVSPTTDKFVNRLMFPIADATGRIIGFGGRTLDGSGAKYVNSPTTPLFDKSNCLYGLNYARQQIDSSATAVVVEGYTDCIMPHQVGCTNVVATLGTSFTSGHARILRRYAKKIVLIFDSDTAGLEAANRALEVCLAQKVDIKIASVPQGKDPCDFVLTAGKDAFEKLIAEAVDVFAFKWNRLVENLSRTDTLIDNKAAIEEFLQNMAVAVRSGNLSVIDRGLIINRLAGIIGLDAKQINDDLNKRLTRLKQTQANYQKASPEYQEPLNADFGSGFYAVAQREILEVLLNEPKLFEIVKSKVTPNVFDVPVLGGVANIIFETLNAEPNAALTDILARAESTELAAVIVELAQAGEQKANYQPRLTGALDAVERHLAQKGISSLKELKDNAELLKKLGENIPKQNPHSVGLI